MSQEAGNPMKRAQVIATVVLVLAIVLLAGLLGRVAWIQKHTTEEDLNRLAKQHDARIELLPNVGAIMARDGTPLAVSVRMYNLYADPAFIADPTGKVAECNRLEEQLAQVPPDGELAGRLEAKIRKLEGEIRLEEGFVEKTREQLAEALAPLLNTTPAAVLNLLESNQTYSATGRPRRFLWLAREVDEGFFERFQAEKKRLREAARGELASIKGVKDPEVRAAAQERARVLAHALDGVGFQKSIKRKYPMGSLAGPVIGYRSNYEGVDGLEYQLDDLLRGRAGQIMAIKDARRQTVMVQASGYKPPENGCNVWLTIDTVIQSIAEEELAKACEKFNVKSGVAIVMEPATGRILAMANWPPFDPGQYQQARAEDRRNKAFDPYEPGSIFKPFVAAWAIEKNVVGSGTVINCFGGRWHDPTGRLVTDVHGYGAMSVEDILIKSSNIGMTQIGWKMGVPTLHEAVTTFGFGQRTGIESPGDEKGIVTPLAKWNRGTLTSVSFGYEVAATPLQLVRGFGAFGNGGYLVSPRILEGVEVAPGEFADWKTLAGSGVTKQILSKRTVDAMLHAMEGVYTRGTARSAASKRYRLFGKTGTAHLAIRGAGRYADDQYNSSFLVGGPVSNPQLVGVISLRQPDRRLGHFGGTVAAPAASQMMERCLGYMRVPPDQTAPPPRTSVARH